LPGNARGQSAATVDKSSVHAWQSERYIHFASSLIHANVDIAAVSSALGHSAITTTSSIYLHAFQDANARASEAIASVLDFSKKKRNDPDDGNLQAMAS